MLVRKSADTRIPVALAKKLGCGVGKATDNTLALTREAHGVAVQFCRLCEDAAWNDCALGSGDCDPPVLSNWQESAAVLQNEALASLVCVIW